MKNIINTFLGYQDKITHFFTSGWIFAMMFSFLESIWITFLITFLIGIIKEVYDWKYRNGADFYDVIANLLGIFLTMFILFIL